MRAGEIIEYKGMQIVVLRPKDPDAPCNGCMFYGEGACAVAFDNSMQCWDSKGRTLTFKEIKK